MTTPFTEPLVLPAGLVDADDARRIAHVHPADWRNPAPKKRYHLVVIGGGTAGLVSAAIAAGLGATVALVERHWLGGDCLNVGCVPSKAIIRAATAWREARTARARFGGPAAEGDGDFAEVMRRMRALRADIAPVDGAPRFRDLGVDVFLGDGRFVASDAVEVAGATLRFRRAIVATGARATVPRIPGLAEAQPFTNETIFDLVRRPEHLMVLGAGAIGCELAQAFARLGTRVTVFNRAARALPGEDAEAGAIVGAALARDGVRMRHGVAVDRVQRTATGIRVYAGQAGDGEVADGDALLVAAGRTPSVAGLGLEAAGIEATGEGIVVDDRLRTTNSRVWAIGDVASRYRFTHAADFQARLAVQNALFYRRGKASGLVIPWVTYTRPEVATVGLTTVRAEAEGIAHVPVYVPMRDVDRAKLDDEGEGFLRVLLAPGSDRILGATLVGAHAGETIGELALAMTAGLGLGAIGRTIHPYPTQAEILRKAADVHRRGALTPRVRALFARYFRLVR